MNMTSKIKPNLITFDVYSALVDYSSVLRDIFSECSGLSAEKSLDLVYGFLNNSGFKNIKIIDARINDKIIING